MNRMLTVAIPKGRLNASVFKYFATCNIAIPSHNRALVLEIPGNNLRILLVKNSDLLEYVHAGIASMGIVGSDILYESVHSFFTLGTFPFGNTRICLIGKQHALSIDSLNRTKVASKYARFTTHFLQKRGINAEIIKLHGSVELAPILQLAPYIVDLVETGRTLQENGLEILENLGHTKVQFITNKALYKLQYKEIDTLAKKLKL